MLGGRITTMGFLAALSLGAALAACSSSDDDGKGTPDGGPSAGGDGGSGTGGKGGAGGSATGGTSAATGGTKSGSGGGVTCGGDPCTTTAEGTGVQAFPCCTVDDTCGVRVPIAQSCLAKNQFGTTNPECPTYELPGKITAAGCCTTRGCGARITFENVGCVLNEDLGQAHVDCNQSGEPAGGKDASTDDGG